MVNVIIMVSYLENCIRATRAKENNRRSEILGSVFVVCFVFNMSNLLQAFYLIKRECAN